MNEIIQIQKCNNRHDEGEELSFEGYINKIIHKWATVLAWLGATLVPTFFLLDMVVAPRELWVKFAVYRIIATLINIAQIIILRKTNPSKLSYLHSFLFSLAVGGAIIFMTSDLGGFSSGYYVGIILVLQGTNLLIPWKGRYSLLNGAFLIAMYIGVNLLIHGLGFKLMDLVNNFFFLFSTVIITSAVRYRYFKTSKNDYDNRHELRQVRDALWGEMKTASKIQTVLLPDEPKMKGFEVNTYTQPAIEVGGDYHDIINVKNKDWVIIGDVSGHGIPAGLIMVMVQTAIHLTLSQNPDIKPSDLLAIINKTIYDNINQLGGEKYMTLTALKNDKNSFTFSGLHLDILVYRKKTKKVEVVQTDGMWLGIMENITKHNIDLHFKVNKGDVILLHTDGITEAWSKFPLMENDDPFDYMYSQKRLIQIFKENGENSLDEIKSCILKDLKSFKYKDDITLVLLKKE